METNLQLQVEKKESKLWHYRRYNEDLCNMNTKSKVMIKIHKIQERFNEQIFFEQNNQIEILSTKIEELKDESDFNQRLKNQDIKKEINNYEAEIIRLNKTLTTRMKN